MAKYRQFVMNGVVHISTQYNRFYPFFATCLQLTFTVCPGRDSICTASLLHFNCVFADLAVSYSASIRIYNNTMHSSYIVYGSRHLTHAVMLQVLSSQTGWPELVGQNNLGYRTVSRTTRQAYSQHSLDITGFGIRYHNAIK